jgi:hypothetical protein
MLSRWLAARWPALVLCILLYGLVELGSYGVLAYYRHVDQRYIKVTPEALAARVTDREIAVYNAWQTDPLLGWDYRPGFVLDRGGWDIRIGADGARFDPAATTDVPDIDVYGASYAIGAEVHNDETWEHYLGQSLGRHVANFGGVGYGPDQALLRYKIRHAARQPRPSIVILVITAEEPGRIINRYKQFYAIGLMPIAFKPRFVLERGGLRLIPPPSGIGAITRENLPGLIATAEPGDGWRARQVALAWPWWLNLARLVPVAIADQLHIDLPSLGILQIDLWRSPATMALLRAVIDDFVATAQARGSTPVILFIPVEPRPGVVPPYTAFARQLRRELAPKVPVIDVEEASFDRARFSVRLYSGHPSPYGNRAIAAHVAAALAGWPPRHAAAAGD